MTAARALRIVVFSFLVIGILSAALDVGAQTPTPGQNINIASGPAYTCPQPVGSKFAALCPASGATTIVGDPFLQRQNEPSVAVSTVNPLHLLAGTNDYRAVDIPLPDVIPSTLAGDAWCGWFFSPDGGQNWQSTLLPGFPQDNSVVGMTSPLKGFQFCSDPTVRPGPGGMFFYSGIAGNRGSNTSIVFISRFLDRNNSENGNIALNSMSAMYVDTIAVDTGNSGQFIDKTWNAVLLQPGNGTCTVQVPTGNGLTTSVQVPSMTVYVVWSRFTGSNSSKIMVTKSDQCGNPGTYATPVKVSESNSVNQGASVAVNQATGDVHVAWRRFLTSSQPDAIVTSKCNSSLKTCTKAIDITASLPSDFMPFKPFDQDSTSSTFRTRSMPAIAISVDKFGTARVHVAFSARRNADGDARVLLATSSDGVKWQANQIQPVDPNPIVVGGVNFSRGHQLMPAMTFTEGKLMLAYYFSHFDHTVGRLIPNDPFAPDSTGKFFAENRDVRGATDLNSPYFFNLDDQFMVERRHTLDVRMAESDVADTPFAPSYGFTTTKVSQYVVGLVTDAMTGQQIFQDFQANPPDLKLFGNGNFAFIGDYIDIAGLMFAQGSPWAPTNAPSKAAVHYVVWADNRDVQPPRDTNYGNFTAVGSTGGPSFYDGSSKPTCLAGQAGLKDQNVYISRVTQGFTLSALQNQKPLLKPDGTPIDRAFTLVAQNSTKDPRNIQLQIGNQPPGGRASFDQGSLVTTVNIFVPPNSGIAQAIFVRSSQNDASVSVNALEGGSFLTGVVLNPPGSVTSLLQPVGVDPNQNIANTEVYNGSLKSGSLKSGSLKSGSLKSGSLKSGSLKSGSLKSGSLKSGSLKSGSLKSTSIADINPTTASSVTLNGDEVDPSLASACTATSDPDGSITDAIYVLSNDGNTIATYTISLLGTPPAPTPQCPNPVQLIIAAPGTAVTAEDCELVQQDDTTILANITDISQLSNLSISVPPGESLLVTIRGGSLNIVENAIEETVPAASAPADSNGNPAPLAVPLFITTTTLGDATVNAPYATTLQAIGGTLPYQWDTSVLEGSLPPGLTLDSTGAISGTPTLAGTYIFKVQVCDATLPSGTPCDDTAPFDSRARKNLTLTAKKGAQTITVTTEPPPQAVYNTSFNVAATASSGLPVDISTTGVCSGSGTGSATVTMTSGTGTCTVHFNQAGDDNYAAAPEVLRSVTALKADQTITVITAAPAQAVYNTSFNVAATASSSLAVAVTTTGVCSGSGSGTAAVTMTSGTGTCTVHYNQAGNDNYNPAPEMTSSTTALKAASATAITSDTPDPSLLNGPVTVAFVVSAPNGGTTPTGSVTVTSNGSSCTGAISGGSGSCSITLTSVGAKTLTATYSGDSNYSGSSGNANHQVIYKFTGFLSPLNAAGVCPSSTNSGVQKLGSGVPFKWSLQDANGVYIDDLSTIVSIDDYTGTACGALGAGVLLYSPATGLKGGSTLTNDFSSNQFRFVWDTGFQTATGMHTVVITLNDGRRYATTVNLK